MAVSMFPEMSGAATEVQIFPSRTNTVGMGKCP